MLEGSYCKKCGKEFFPTSMHAYKDRSGYYCSWTCFSHRESKKKGIYAFKIECYDLNGNFIDIYDSAEIAAEIHDASGRDIQKACRNGTPYKDHLWRYKK